MTVRPCSGSPSVPSMSVVSVGSRGRSGHGIAGQGDGVMSWGGPTVNQPGRGK
jgi:hypothetical protein